MAKAAKSHRAVAKSRQAKKAVAVPKAKKKEITAKAARSVAPKAAARKSVAEKPAPAKAVAAKGAAAPAPEKKSPGQMFARPVMRRGRRPKALAEYQPNNNEEEEMSQDVDVRGLEYDTGIRVNKPGDDGLFNMDRFEDYDEELNFDY